MRLTKNMKKVFYVVSLFVFLLPVAVLAESLQNVRIFSTTVNNQYRIDGYFTGNTANNANLNPTVGSLNVSGLTDGSMTFKATDLTGLNGNINIGVGDGSTAIAVGNGEVTVGVDALKDASNPVIRATANAASQGDQNRAELNYSYPINVADKNNTVNQNKNSDLPFTGGIGPVGGNTTPDDATAANTRANDPAYGGGSGSGTQLVPCNGVDCNIEMIKTMGVRIYNYLTGFGAILAVAAIVYGGFSYITAQGEPSQMAAAKQKIFYAIIGLILLAASALIVNTLMSWIGVTGKTKQVEDVKAQ